ncbi:MAG TPA: hypothetical protein PKC39_05275 [Ferruginibacter sp.]|nr:hypothetical protein [Ferruginibacter sp.]HMP20353.1 hypothetical protein [Ferruginibacter sp.]
MIKKQYSIRIEAPVTKVVDTMLGLTNINTYEQWTAAFNPTSTYEGSWDEGSNIRFVGIDKEGKKGGMLSRIVSHVPNSFVSIEHYGMFEGDKEITEGPLVAQWAGGKENYSFEPNGNATQLLVEVDVTEDHADYFDSTYPKALQVLKQITE